VHWFEKYIVDITAIFQSVLVIFSNSVLSKNISLFSFGK
jgi:hypothetical protein